MSIGGFYYKSLFFAIVTGVVLQMYCSGHNTLALILIAASFLILLCMIKYTLGILDIVSFGLFIGVPYAMLYIKFGIYGTGFFSVSPYTIAALIYLGLSVIFLLLSLFSPINFLDRTDILPVQKKCEKCGSRNFRREMRTINGGYELTCKKCRAQHWIGAGDACSRCGHKTVMAKHVTSTGNPIVKCWLCGKRIGPSK